MDSHRVHKQGEEIVEVRRPNAQSAQGTPPTIVEQKQLTPKAVGAEAKQTGGVMVLQWLSYAFWGWLVGFLAWLFSVTVRVLLGGDPEGNSLDSIPYALSAVIVLTPVAFTTDLFYRKHEQVKKQSVAMVIMVVHAVLFALIGIGALITAVFMSLHQIIEGRSGVDQTVSVLTAVFIAVSYTLLLLRVLVPGGKKKLTTITSWTLLAVSTLLIVLAIVGPVAQSVRMRDDRQIDKYLYSVQYGINDYVQDNNKLPATLDDVDWYSRGGEELQQFVKKGVVDYKNDGTSLAPSTGYQDRDQTYHKYQLCVTYVAANGKKDREYVPSHDYEAASLSEYKDSVARYHPAGRVCYKLRELSLASASTTQSEESTKVEIDYQQAG